MKIQKRSAAAVMKHSIVPIAVVGLAFAMSASGAVLPQLPLPPNIFVVQSSEDGGVVGSCPGPNCTLRAAIAAANATPNRASGPDIIRFAIPGVGLKLIRPATLMPAITEAVLIDGYSQSGASPNTIENVGQAFPETNAIIHIALSSQFIDNAGSLLHVSTGAGTTIRGLHFTATEEAVRCDARCIIKGNLFHSLNEGDFGVRIVADNSIVGSSPGATAIQQNADRNIFLGSNDGIALAGLLVQGSNTHVADNFFGRHPAGMKFGRFANGIINLGDTSSNSVFLRNDFIGAGYAMQLQGQGHITMFNTFRSNPIGVLFSASNMLINHNRFENGDLGLTNVGISEPNGNRFEFNTFVGHLKDIQLDAQTNDLLDRDTGANRKQNFPVLADVNVYAHGFEVGGPQLNVRGTLHSHPNENFQLEFCETKHPNANGRGGCENTFLTVTVTTDARGNVNFTRFIPLPAGVQANTSFISALATRHSTNDTSEFGPNAQVQVGDL